MNITVKMTKEMVLDWCKENNYLLADAYTSEGIKSLSRHQIQSEGINGVLRRVCEEYKYTVHELTKKTRKAEILRPRQIAHYICDTYLPDSLSVIGAEIGNVDHATVINSCKKIGRFIEDEKLFRTVHHNILKLYSLC